VLDPTNTMGTYWGSGAGIAPMRQAIIRRYNPAAAEWQTRFRGWVESITFTYDPSRAVSFVEFALVDIFEMLATIEMVPGAFGDDPAVVAPDSAGSVVFENDTMKDRIDKILDDALGATAASNWTVVFTGNVEVSTTVYSPGETVLSAIQEAADAEFPGVSNCYGDRFGRLAVHGRLAKFDPVGTAASTTPDRWTYGHWFAGDGADVAAHPTARAHIRQFGYDLDVAKVINQAVAYPQYKLDGTDQVPFDPAAAADDLASLVEVDTVSQGIYGIRSWSAPNLITLRGLAGLGTTAIEETNRFAQYMIANYAAPRNRVTAIQLRSKAPGTLGATYNWRVLSELDVGDRIDVTIEAPGAASSTGGFNLEPYFVEGIHEQVNPLSETYDDVTMTLDLSPMAYFTDTSMFPDG
jgi:hypothetical protein